MSQLSEHDIHREIEAIKVQQRERVQDLDTRLAELHVLQQEMETARLATVADKTLQMVDAIKDIAGMAMVINALGKWDIWMNITPHVDWIEIKITRRGSYNDTLWARMFHYRFPEDKFYYTVEDQLKIANEIKVVLADFISNDDPERHLKEEY